MKMIYQDKGLPEPEPPILHDYARMIREAKERGEAEVRALTHTAQVRFHQDVAFHHRVEQAAAVAVEWAAAGPMRPMAQMAAAVALLLAEQEAAKPTSCACPAWDCPVHGDPGMG